LLGIVATYSFGGGFLFWPVGLGILAMAKIDRAKRMAILSSWISVGLLTAGSYFYHYHSSAEHGSLNLAFVMPIEYACYVSKYLGGICAQYVARSFWVDALGVLAGAGAVVLAVWAAWTLSRRKVIDVKVLIPYVGLSLYSIGNALATGAGRLGFESHQALSSRYCTLNVPLWVTLIVLLTLVKESEGRIPNGQIRGAFDCRKIAGWSLGVVTVMLILSSAFAVSGAKKMSETQASGRSCLLSLATNPTGKIDYSGLAALYPRPAVIVERFSVLQEHHLSVFKKQ
jgi:hypothetical protein